MQDGGLPLPIATGGDVYSRYLVRLEELRQGMAIISQLVDNIPPGPVDVLPKPVVLIVSTAHSRLRQNVRGFPSSSSIPSW